MINVHVVVLTGKYLVSIHNSISQHNLAFNGKDQLVSLAFEMKVLKQSSNFIPTHINKQIKI